MAKILSFVYKELYRRARLQYIRFRREVMAQGEIAKLSDISILYEDNDYIIVNKHYDVKVNSEIDGEVTVANQIAQIRPDLVDNSLSHFIRFCHRLDYATSGVLCLAKHKKAASRCGKAFQRSEVSKHYLALVRGHVNDSEMVINMPIGIKQTIVDRAYMCPTTDPDCFNAKSSVTKLFVLEKGTYSGDPVSKVLLIPFTGRTHQLRVHCRHIGHTIVGDYLYSDRTDIAPYRMMLHAHRLILPIKAKTIDITAPDMFIPDVDSRWQPSEICAIYNDYLIASSSVNS